MYNHVLFIGIDTFVFCFTCFSRRPGLDSPGRLGLTRKLPSLASRAFGGGRLRLLLCSVLLSLLLTVLLLSLPMLLLEKIARRKLTPRKSSWIFGGIFQWMLSSIFQRDSTFQLHVPMDWHLSGGFLLEMSNGSSMAFSNGMLLFVMSGV